MRLGSAITTTDTGALDVPRRILRSMADRLPTDDTSDEARAVMRRLYASMTPAEKLKCMSELTAAACRLSLAGLRSRHPGESESALLLRLARMRLGDALTDRVYGSRRGA